MKITNKKYRVSLLITVKRGRLNKSFELEADSKSMAIEEVELNWLHEYAKNGGIVVSKSASASQLKKLFGIKIESKAIEL